MSEYDIQDHEKWCLYEEGRRHPRAGGEVMTDRELLERAAKAAGKDGWRWDTKWKAMFSPNIKTPYGNARSYWNPIEDDCAAIQLAAQMQISIIYETEWPEGKIIRVVEAVMPEGIDGNPYCALEALGEDPAAATRRAIVRAAAQAGKEK